MVAQSGADTESPGEAQRTLADLFNFIGIHQVPVNIFDLGHSGDYLCFECKVGDLGVTLRNADKALVGSDTETGQQRLLDDHLKIGIELRIDDVVRRVLRNTLAKIVHL